MIDRRLDVMAGTPEITREGLYKQVPSLSRGFGSRLFCSTRFSSGSCCARARALAESVGSIADDLVARTGGVPGVAYVQCVDVQAATSRRNQQTADGNATAGRLGTQPARIE